MKRKKKSMAIAPVNMELVESVAQKLRDAGDQNGLASACAAGQIVIDAMFPSCKQIEKKLVKKDSSYRALAKRKDIGLSASNLWYAVAIYQNCELFGDCAQELTISAHRRLAHVADPETRLDLAQRAVAEKMTIEQIEQEIAALVNVENPKRGRKAMPVGQKKMAELTRQIQALRKLSSDDVIGSDLGNASALFAKLKSSEAELMEWMDKISLNLEPPPAQGEDEAFSDENAGATCRVQTANSGDDTVTSADLAL